MLLYLQTIPELKKNFPRPKASHEHLPQRWAADDCWHGRRLQALQNCVMKGITILHVLKSGWGDAPVFFPTMAPAMKAGVVLPMQDATESGFKGDCFWLLEYDLGTQTHLLPCQGVEGCVHVDLLISINPDATAKSESHNLRTQRDLLVFLGSSLHLKQNSEQAPERHEAAASFSAEYMRGSCCRPDWRQSRFQTTQACKSLSHISKNAAWWRAWSRAHVHILHGRSCT